MDHMKKQKSFKQVTKLQPDFVEALNYLVYAYMCMEKYEEAEDVVMQAVRINPKNADTYFNLGTIYSRKICQVAINYLLKALNYILKM